MDTFIRGKLFNFLIPDVGGCMKIQVFILFFSLFSLGQIYTGQVSYSERKIIGDNNMIEVDTNLINIPMKYRRVAESVGFMSVGCTGTHIGQGYVVSAGHCFESKERPSYNKGCSDLTVTWGDIRGRTMMRQSRCIEVLVSQASDSKDYVLFKVNNPPNSFIPLKPFGRSLASSKVTIFSHPFGSPLMWSGICQIKQVFSSGVNMNLIHHSCDTNPGSSGAAIIDAENIEIIGLHNGGWADSNSGINYGTYIDDTPIPYELSRRGLRF